MSDNAGWTGLEEPGATPWAGQRVPSRFASWFQRRGMPEDLWARELWFMRGEGYGRAIDTALAEEEQTARLASERLVLEARVTRQSAEVEAGLARVERQRAESDAARAERSAAAVRLGNEQRLLTALRESGGGAAGRLRAPIGGRSILSRSDAAFGRGGDLGMR
jgi:hypothetical protein